MTPLALHWPEGAHMIQVIPVGPSRLEMYTPRGVAQPNCVSVDPSYRPCSEEKSASSPNASIHNACSLRSSIFISIQELHPQFCIDFPLFFPPPTPSSITQNPSLLLAATKQSIFIQFKWQLLREASLRHLIQQLFVSIFISPLDCLFLKFRDWVLFIFIAPTAPIIVPSTWSFLNKYLFIGIESHLRSRV